MRLDYTHTQTHTSPKPQPLPPPPPSPPPPPPTHEHTHTHTHTHKLMTEPCVTTGCCWSLPSFTFFCLSTSAGCEWNPSAVTREHTHSLSWTTSSEMFLLLFPPELTSETIWSFISSRFHENCSCGFENVVCSLIHQEIHGVTRHECVCCSRSCCALFGFYSYMAFSLHLLHLLVHFNCESWL